MPAAGRYEFDPPHSFIFGDHDIGRFQIEVNDPGRVGRRERIGDVERILRRVFHRQAPAGIRLLERRASHVLHRNEADTVLLRDVVDRHDVGMIQPGRGLGFDQELSRPVSVRDSLWRESLQGNDSVQPGVASLVDLPHPSRPEKGEDFVRAETFPGGKGQGDRF